MFWTPHPYFPVPTEDEVLKLTKNPDGSDNLEGLLKLDDLWQTRETAIKMAEDDPLNHGFRFPSYDKILPYFNRFLEVIIFGGNGSGKSQFAAWCVVKALLENPGTKIVCFAQDKDASRQIQQTLVYQHLPPQYRHDHTTKMGGYLRYKPKNGFTDDSFFLDVGDGTKVRECYFKTYAQFFQNRAKFEGFEYGSRMPRWQNVAVWMDEYLIGPELYNTILYRVGRRGAIMLTTLTPIKGLTPFVADKVKGSTIVETRKTDPRLFDHQAGEPAEVEWVREKLFPKQDGMKENGVAMVFFPSQDNPWSGYDSMLRLHRHKSLEERLCRFHGITTQVAERLIPLFSRDVNVVNRKTPNRAGVKVPENIHDRSEFTWYQIVDPAKDRNCAACWIAVSRTGEYWVMREWPDMPTYGDWAKPGTPNWTKGDAADSFGYNVESYANLFRELEEQEDITPFVRIGDSRYFSSPNDNATNLFEDYIEQGLEFEPSDGRNILKGVQKINELCYYNVDKAVDSINRPKLFVLEDCGNIIQAMENYQKKGKKDEALKDFFDLIRMAATYNGGEGLTFVDKDILITESQQQTWGYGCE